MITFKPLSKNPGALHSPEYQEAKKLREGFIKSNFIIAIEATD